MTGPGASLVRSDATAIPLGDNTVDLIVTSPPYFALRSYQDGGEHYGGQIGSEDTPTAFLEALWAVTAECWRVLKPTGSLFVNLGDKYAGTGAGGTAKPHTGTIAFAGQAKNAASRPPARGTATTDVRAKSLMGLPWRYAIGCIDGQADPDGRGWVLRSEIIWSKSNGLPESVTDRVRRSHEQWFHLTREGRYYSNVDEVREAHEGPLHAPGDKKVNNDRNDNDRADRVFGHPLGKLPGSVVPIDDVPWLPGDVAATLTNPDDSATVWTVPTQPLIVPDWLDVDHFAAFPTEWPRRLILGWSPPGICVECGEGRRAVVAKERLGDCTERRTSDRGAPGGAQGNNRNAATYEVTGTACACDKPTAPTTPAVVLDPFSGTGTVAGVARALGRYGVGCDLSADYMRLARWRIWQSGMGAKVESRTNGERQGVLL